LATLVSQTLVAFTIEFDNEAEHQLHHRTTRGASGSQRGAWLTSQAMWANFMQFVDADGVRLGEMEGLAAITNLEGLKRWRLIDVGPDPLDDREKPPLSELVVRPTRAGRRAQEIWRPLTGVIEQRWRERFGDEVIEALSEALQLLGVQSESRLPPYLPVVYNRMSADLGRFEPSASMVAARSVGVRLDLSVLLSHVLLMFTVDFERQSKLSLPISANALRVLDETGVRVRDIPRMTGVSKEAIAMSTGLLQRLECAFLDPDPTASRGKVVRLTPKGLKAQEKFHRILDGTEEQWRTRFGEANIARLRALLEQLVGEPTARVSPLFLGLEPYPECWRASVRRPEMLPHYPMVLHRGGYPDGS